MMSRTTGHTHKPVSNQYGKEALLIFLVASFIQKQTINVINYQQSIIIIGQVNNRHSPALLLYLHFSIRLANWIS